MIGLGAEVGSLGIDIGGTNVKACLYDSQLSGTCYGRSGVYCRPTRMELVRAVREAIEELATDDVSQLPIGLCVPGRRAADGESIELAVNLPCLEGWCFVELLCQVLGAEPKSWRLMNDVQSAGSDYLIESLTENGASDGEHDRTAVIAIGTGVGLAVFDGTKPVGIGSRAIGHLGMIDVGQIGERDMIAPDGSVNILESFVGARAIENRFPELQGSELVQAIGSLSTNDPILIAMIRAIRIVHAIYTPRQIVLMGGVGIAFKPIRDALVEAVNTGLSRVACSEWTLEFGESPFHAARGAARCAVVGTIQSD